MRTVSRYILLPLGLVALNFVLLFAHASVPESFSNVVKETLPAVVSIRSVRSQEVRRGGGDSPLEDRLPPSHPLRDLLERFGLPDGNTPEKRRGVADGSGFLIASDGVVVTNNHVIADSDEITVTLEDGESYQADLLGTDPQTDLAVLRLRNVERSLPYLRFGDSDKAEVGDWTLAIGNPLGQLGGSVTAGIISARNRDIRTGIYDDYIQTDTSINQGNSGGPLLNTFGEVIGVNTIIFSTGGGSIGLSFSIPSNLAKLVTTQLLETGSAQRGWLGVEIQNVSDDIAQALDYKGNTGALIVKVRPDTPAEMAGLKEYDILMKFDQQEVPNARRLPLIVGLSRIGSLVEMEVWREGRQVRLTALIGQRESDQEQVRTGENSSQQGSLRPSKSFGFGVGALTDEFRSRLNLDKNLQGVLIVEVDQGSPADVSGLSVGDVIIELDRKRVTSVEQVQQLMDSFQKSGRNVLVLKLVKRNGGNAIVGLRIGK